MPALVRAGGGRGGGGNVQGRDEAGGLEAALHEAERGAREHQGGRQARAVLGSDTGRARELPHGLLGRTVVRPEEGVFVDVRRNPGAALGVPDNWSGERESNPHHRLGRPELYH